MSGFAAIFAILSAILILALPRRWAPLPFLIGICYMTLGQGIALGPFNFTVIRLLILAGAARLLIRGEFASIGFNTMDRIAIAWAIWTLFSSFFHAEPREALIFRMGVTFNALGVYFLFRSFIKSQEDAVRVAVMAAIVLIPVAAEMLSEKATGRNAFAVLGGVPPEVAERNGKLRAQGPFAHPILAGTVGAVCLPFIVGLWVSHRKIAIAGITACVAMVIASASSGPLMSVIFSLGALAWWKRREYTARLRWFFVFMYLVLEMVMKAPAYFIIARIDVAGGSTGWHRAELMRSAFSHFGEWWMTGTDVTRHWMPTGVSWNVDHTDITNHFLQQGVWGGLPMMLLLIGMIWVGFRNVGRILALTEHRRGADPFLIWCWGASLFAVTASCISVSFFDQSFAFLYLLLATLSSLYNDALSMEPAWDQETDPVEEFATGTPPNSAYARSPFSPTG